jgi:hypothetical protein
MSVSNSRKFLKKAVMDDALTADEYDALGQISKGQKQGRPSACVARNAKRLSGLKYTAYAKDGSLSLTEKGQQTLFIRNCIDGLRAVSTDPLAPLTANVVTFLGKKGHIVADAATGGYAITKKGCESLTDIDSTAS